MKTFSLNSRILAGSAFLFVAGLLLCILMPTPASASNSWGNYYIGSPYILANEPGTDDFYTDYPQYSGSGSPFPGGGTSLGFVPTYIQVKLHSSSVYTCSNIVNIDLYATNGSTSAGTTGSFTDIGGGVCQAPITGGANVALGYVAVCATGGCGSATSENMILDGNVANSGYIGNGSQTVYNAGGFAFQLCDTVDCPGTSFATPSYCNDGVMNGSETGIDIGGSCAVVSVNTPADTSTTNDFSNFSVSYSGVDISGGQHEIWLHWSDSNSLMTTCVNGVMGGSHYFGDSYVAGSSYSTCTNSIPNITIEKNNISFSSGITSYTGTIPKTKQLVEGKTYYAQAFVVDTTSGYIYMVKSPVISFTMSGGVPVISGSGTISNSAGDGTITGTSTHFLNTIKVGDIITVVSDSQSCRVLSVVSDTELECTPLTSAHTTQAYTQNSVPNQGIDYEECSSFDIACGLKNVFKWLFSVSPSTLNQFSNLTLANKAPFAYLYDVGTIFNELFANSGSMSYAVSASTPIGTINFISASAISAVPYASTIKTILGYMLYFFTAMTIYRLLLRVHNK